MIEEITKIYMFIFRKPVIGMCASKSMFTVIFRVKLIVKIDFEAHMPITGFPNINIYSNGEHMSFEYI